MSSETVTTKKDASSGGCCGGGKEKSAKPADVKPATKPQATDEPPAPAKMPGSCCSGDSHS